MDLKAAIAAVRFGQGRRPGDPIPTDPVAWLDSQLAPGLPGPALPEDLPKDLPALYLAAAEDTERLRTGGQGRPNQQLINRAETTAALGLEIAGDQGFRERLASFWTNHFSIARSRVQYVAGHYVREAIRPHVTGRFEDMLMAVVRHPAMLGYLDNTASVGPNSPAGQRGRRGLNENLAREVLELHTVTPASGYGQADVTAFAAVLTGWSFDGARPPYGFLFRPNAHEPGEKTVLGRRFAEGEQGGIAALHFLANHDATHRHLATKLVRHFVADDPPPAAVQTIHGVLRDTRGDLGAAAKALVRLEAAWDPPLGKFRSSHDYVVAVLRALEAPIEVADRAFGGLQYLGQPMWNPPAPIGFPDTSRDWAAPEMMVRRIEWSNGIATRGAGRDAAALAEAVLGPLCRLETLRAASRAGSARDALTLVLTSPEFHRR